MNAPPPAPPRPLHVKEGDPVPDLTLPDQDGHSVALRKFPGKRLVLYFYPQDDTPGCTREACGFRDDHPRFVEAGIVVLGVSTDDAASHRAFIAKFSFPFPLLADTDKALTTAVGALDDDGTARRVTLLVDGTGIIRKVYPKVTATGHAKEVWDALQAVR